VIEIHDQCRYSRRSATRGEVTAFHLEADDFTPGF